MSTSDGEQVVQSVDRAIQILEILAREGAVGVSDIARHLQVHRSTAFRLLATLEARDLVEQETHRGTYRLGLGMLRLAGDVTARLDVAAVAKAACDEVTAAVNETSNVAILDDGAAVNIAQATGANAVAIARQYVGQRSPLHATSTGKVLLAFATPDLLRATIDAGLERFTPDTLTDPAALTAHLAQVRENGWAAALQEWEAETNAISVPVHGRGGAVVAALSVTAPEFRMPPEELPALAAILRLHADRLGGRLEAGQGA